VRHGSDQVIFESYPVLGYNYRMTDIQAAAGREQLKRLAGIVARRRDIAQRYRELLVDAPGLRLPYEPRHARSNWQSFCVRLPDQCEQRALMQMMLDRGIATRRGIMCSQRESIYRESCRQSCLAHSEAAQDRCILLPLHFQMTDADLERVVRSLREGCQK
jgi:perosamine synthetase